MFILYDIAFLIFAAAYLPYLLVRGKGHEGFRGRFGFFPLALSRALQAKKTIWIHAVSVGEVLAVLNLIRAVRERLPEYTIVLSTVTSTGNQLAVSKLKGEAVVIYAPLDFSWIVRRYIKIIRPQMYICAETEIWPNLYTFLRAGRIPIVLVNGRISDRAFAGYRKISFVMKPILKCVRLFCMQSQLDADRIIQLGADRDKVRVAGNLKFDDLSGTAALEKKDMGWKDKDQLFIAGSTHPGEEEIVVRVYQRLVMEFPDLRLVIAPRHAHRADEIVDLVKDIGLNPVKFSQLPGSGIDPKVVVVDTIGHLRDLYGLADVVFVGKSLKVGGGQNMLEPLSLGKATVVGPMTQNFRDVIQIFAKTGALSQITNEDELFSTMRDLLSDPQKRNTLGLSARQMIREHQGAAARTVNGIVTTLQKQ